MRSIFSGPLALDPGQWRPDLLALLLKASAGLAAIIYAPKLFDALRAASLATAVRHTAIVVGVIGTVCLIALARRVPFKYRAGVFCAVSYGFAAWALATDDLGMPYLLGVSIVTTLLLGWRAGAFTVVLNALTLLAAAATGVTADVPLLADDVARAGRWSNAILDFLLVDGLLTLAVGAVLGVAEHVQCRALAERELDRGDRRFRALIEHGTDGIALLDAQQNIIYVSPSITAVEGYSPEEVIGRSALEHAHPDELSTCIQAGQWVLENPGRPYSGVWRRRHKDGHWLWLEVVLTNRLDDPAVGAIVTNYRDVTARVLAEATLRESEERLRVLDRLAQATRAVVAPDEIMAIAVHVLGEHLRASRCAYAHVAPDGDHFTIPHDYVDGCASIVGEGRLSDFGPRAAEELRAGRTLVIRDLAAEIGADGDAALVGLGIKAFICGALVRGGRLQALMAVHQAAPRDWTTAEIALVQAVVERCWATIENARTAERLRSSEQHLRAVIDASPDSIALLARDGSVLEVNPAGLALRGAAEQSEVLGQNAFASVAPEDLERVRAFHAAVFAGRGGSIEYDMLDARGKRRTVDTVSVPLAGAEGQLLHLAIARDVTETKRLEDQLRQSQKMEAIGQLAGGIAHDFNNLLTVVIGYCDILAAKRVLSSVDQSLLDEVRKAGGRAAALTRQLLAFGRRQVLEPRVLSLNSVVADMERMLRRLIGADVALGCTLDHALLNVRVDAGQIEQVLVNLAVNARDAMPQGGTLDIATTNVEWTSEDCAGYPERLAGRYAALSITDSGCGMSPEVLARIFEPFFTTKGPGKGTGLGLPVVHGIVKQSGGFIEVRSAENAGTTFVAYFPAIDEPVERTIPAHEEVVAPRGTETVLVVEDENEVRTLVRNALEAHGYSVIEAENGGAALRAVARQDGAIDLLVTDVIMPEMGGREVAGLLRERQPDLKVLYMSGYSDDAVLRDGRLDPQQAFLQKPFTPAALMRKVRELLDVQGARRVLLIDDEPPLLLLVARGLEDRGYTVVTCGSGKEALATFARDPAAFDVVVSDLRMHDMSGIEVASALRASQPKLPIFLATGYVDDEIRTKAFAAGASAVLPKPTAVDDLCELIHGEAQRASV